MVGAVNRAAGRIDRNCAGLDTELRDAAALPSIQCNLAGIIQATAPVLQLVVVERLGGQVSQSQIRLVATNRVVLDKAELWVGNIDTVGHKIQLPRSMMNSTGTQSDTLGRHRSQRLGRANLRIGVRTRSNQTAELVKVGKVGRVDIGTLAQAGPDGVLNDCLLARYACLTVDYYAVDGHALVRKTGESANATHRLGFVGVMTIRHVTIDGDWSCHDQLNRLILANAERRAGNGDVAGMVGNQSVETSLQVQGGLAGYDLVRILRNGIVDAVLPLSRKWICGWAKGTLAPLLLLMLPPIGRCDRYCTSCANNIGLTHCGLAYI